MSIQNSLNSKLIAIAVLALLLLIPLAMVKGVIKERLSYRESVHKDIATSWTGAQQITGLILVVPYKVRIHKTLWDKERKISRQEVQERWRQFYLVADQLNLQAEVNTEMRYRGIYGVPVYTAELELNGSFSSKRLVRMAAERNDIIDWGRPYLSLGVSDSRGISNQPTLSWNGAPGQFVSGPKTGLFPQGIHAELPAIDPAQPKDLAFAIQLTLRGMEQLSFTPSGLDNRVQIHSDWSHPSFQGQFLPVEYASDGQGFSARWQVASFGTDVERLLEQLNSGKNGEFSQQRFGVSLVDPVDIYLQSTRSAKYGVLFIALTFVAFLLFEVFQRLRIHPLQYGLVGMSLVLFYLLLIALSEHIGFAPAYASGTLACSGLLGIYTAAVLKNRKLGITIGLVIATLYAMLYVILQSEDHALLMGSLLLFGLFSLTLLATRHLDWYAVSERMNLPKGE